MIHGSSIDPVFIKKIELKIWTLRSEVESVIQKGIEANKDKSSLSEEEVQKIKNEYLYRGPIGQRPKLNLLQGGEEDSSKDEDKSNEDPLDAVMEAAMGDEAEGSDDSEESKDDEETLKIVQRKSENIPPSEIYKGVGILGELSMEGIYFFCSEQFLEGQSIVIEFQIPTRFVLNAQIVYSRQFNAKSRIISNCKMTTRAGARFTFLKDGERTLLRNFIRSIEPQVQSAGPKASSNAAKEDSSDFEGLEDLGF